MLNRHSTVHKRNLILAKSSLYFLILAGAEGKGEGWVAERISGGKGRRGRGFERDGKALIPEA